MPAGTLRLYVIGFEPGRPGGPQRITRAGAGQKATLNCWQTARDRSGGEERPSSGRDRFTVVGLVEDAMNSGAIDPAVYVTLADALTLQTAMDGRCRLQAARGDGGLRPPTVAAVVARLQPGADVAHLTATVRQWKHLSALSQSEQEQLLLASVVDRRAAQIGLFLGILLSCQRRGDRAHIIYTMTMEKLKQIATLKLIGAPDRTIVGLIVQQALILGISGLAIGLALILLVKDSFPRRVSCLSRSTRAGADRHHPDGLPCCLGSWRPRGAEG